MPMNGSEVLVAVNTGTDESPEWEVIPCQASGEYTLEADTFDTSCKDTGDATNLPGRRSRTMSVEANPGAWPELKTSPTEVTEIVRKAAETGQQIQVAIVVSGTELEQGTATITSYSMAFPDQDKVTLSLELAISGGMTPISA